MPQEGRISYPGSCPFLPRLPPPRTRTPSLHSLCPVPQPLPPASPVWRENLCVLGQIGWRQRRALEPRWLTGGRSLQRWWPG